MRQCKLLLVSFIFLSVAAHAQIGCGTPISIEGSGPTSSYNTLGASLLVYAGVGYQAPNYASDNLGNTWEYGSLYGVGDAGVQTIISFVRSPLTGTAQTFSSSSGEYPSAVVLPCTGSQSSYPLLAQAGNTATSGTTLSPGSVTPAEAGDLIVTVVGCYDSGAVTSFTINDSFSTPTELTNTNYMTGSVSYLVAPNTSAVSPTWTITVANTLSCSSSIAVFAAADHIPPTLTRPYISRVAGTAGGKGYAGDGELASAAKLDWPGAIAVVDSYGSACFPDINNNRIRCVNRGPTTNTFYGTSIPSGYINTVCGDGTLGYNDGACSTAEFGHPVGLAIDSSGNLYVADQQIYAIRKIVPTGAVSTVAGTPDLSPSGCTGQEGGSYGDGGPATSAVLWCPQGVAIDSSGNIYISDSLHYTVRAVNVQATTQTLYGVSVCSGCIETIAGIVTESGCTGNSGSGTSAKLSYPLQLSIDSSGNLYIADEGCSQIRELESGGTLVAFAGNQTAGYSGDGGAATSAEINKPYGVVAAPNGVVYIADTLNALIREVSGGNISTFVGDPPLCLGPYGGYQGDGGPVGLACLASSTTDPNIIGPIAVNVDSSGNLYISDTGNNTVREVYTQTVGNSSAVLEGSVLKRTVME